KEGADELESCYRDTGDPGLAVALAELYFARAVELLGSDPPEISGARESLLLGKHLAAQAKFDYCLGLADLMECRYESAATRLRGVLAANAKNPGASYHLGLALLLAGDARGAETALRHGVAVSFNNPSRLSRLKWALAALLIGQKRWADAAAALEG